MNAELNELREQRKRGQEPDNDIAMALNYVESLLAERATQPAQEEAAEDKPTGCTHNCNQGRDCPNRRR